MSAEKELNGLPDLSHHLSQEAKERLPNSMKVFFRSLEDAPTLTSLANGDPHPSLYPLAQVDFHVPDVSHVGSVSSWLDRASGHSAVQKLSAFNGGKSTIDLSVAMQYGTGLGLATLRDQLVELNRLLHAPRETTHKVTMTLGNADGVTKVYRLLGTPGDTFLAEEYSFCGLTNAPIAQGIKWQPIKADADGLIPEDMEAVLSDWDEASRGRRPHVLYSIPTGQNPTGATLPLARRRAVYAIAQKYDIVIIEDDPYYFFQYEEHGSPQSMASATDAASQEQPRFLKPLVPSFLSMDVDGRVVRVDTVSKTLAPNMRLGWITSNALFTRKLEILIDNSTQHPGGLTQSLLAEILSPSGWGMDGYLRWVRELRNEYQRRRDLFFEVFQREIGARGHASTKLPAAGMFFWIKVHIEGHPRFAVVHPVPRTGPKTNTAELMDELFKSCVRKGLLIMPGVLFAMQPTDKSVAEQASSENHIMDRSFFRATFVGMDETIDKALGIFGSALTDFFQG